MMPNDRESWTDRQIAELKKLKASSVRNTSRDLYYDEEIALFEALKAAREALGSCKVGMAWYGNGPIFDVRLVDIAITKIDELGK